MFILFSSEIQNSDLEISKDGDLKSGEHHFEDI
jgi:hypothetical protein